MKHSVKPEGSEALIRLEQVVREVEGPKQETKRMLNRINWELHDGDRIAVLAKNIGRADAFLECASGVCPVQGGSVTINANVSWPLGEPGAMLGILTGRQNAEFLQKIYGNPRDYRGEMQLIRDLSDLEGDFFDRPMRLYNKYMKSRFRLAVSIAFAFDVYTVPRMPAWPYSSKSLQCKRFKEVFETQTSAKPIIVSHPDFNFQKAYCNKGIILEDGVIIYQGDLESCQEQFTSRKNPKKS
jgi:capsular polysaccharide transport system ATP-binding protein